MTPNGHPATHVPHPLHTSFWTTTVPNSVRNSAPVGHTSRHPAWVQCLHTSEDMSQRKSAVSGGVVSTPVRSAGSVAPAVPSPSSRPPSTSAPTLAPAGPVSGPSCAPAPAPCPVVDPQPDGPQPDGPHPDGPQPEHPAPEAPTAPSSSFAIAAPEVPAAPVGGPTVGIPRPTSRRPDARACSMRSPSCSMNATCRHVFAPRPPVLS